MNVIDDRLLFNLLLSGAFALVSTMNSALAFRDWRQHAGEGRLRGDARGLRGFVASITMLAGVIALIGGNGTFREAWPGLVAWFRVVSSMGVSVFLMGLVFSASTWLFGRRGRR